MLYIVEGADGTGKSTLIEKLKCDLKDNQYLYWKSDRYTDQYKQWKMLKKIAKRKIVITDRSFISELVYRIVKFDKIPNIELKHIIKILDENITIIYCTNKNAYKNATVRGEDYIKSLKEHNKIMNAYETIMSMIKLFTKSKVIDYDFSKYGG